MYSVELPRIDRQGNLWHSKIALIYYVRTLIVVGGGGQTTFNLIVSMVSHLQNANFLVHREGEEQLFRGEIMWL